MLVLYGKLKPGWTKVAIRRSNGLIAYSARKNDPFWMREMVIPFYVTKRIMKKKVREYDTTFIWHPFHGAKTTFG